MRKRRTRKSTNFFPQARSIGALQTEVTSITSANVLPVQILTANALTGTVNLSLAKSDTPQPVNLAANNPANEIKKAIVALQSVKQVDVQQDQNNAKRFVITIKELETSVAADIDSLLLQISNDPNNNVDVRIKTPFEWNWTTVDAWVDRDSGRTVMLAEEMKLTATRRGMVKLTYKAVLPVRRHLWVYKLDAYSVEGQRLLTLVTPQSVYRPQHFTEQEIFTTRIACNQVRADLREIAYWVRRGSGEYLE